MQHSAHYHANLRDVDIGGAAGEQLGAPGPLLLELPEHVMLELLRRVDVFTLCMLSQTCRQLHHLTSTPLLWPGRRLGGPLVRSVRYSLASVLHLPPQIFNVRLEESRSSKFPISVPLHNLRFVMAAGDVEGLAERVSSALQDRIARCPAAALYHPGAACWPNTAAAGAPHPRREQELDVLATSGGGYGAELLGGGSGAELLGGGGGPAALPASAALLLSRADRGFVRLGLRPGVAVAMVLRATEEAAAVPLTAGGQPWGDVETNGASALAPEGEMQEGCAGNQGSGSGVGSGAGNKGSSCPWLNQLGELLDTCWAGVGQQLGMQCQGAAGRATAGARCATEDLAPMAASASATSAGAAEAGAAAAAVAAAEVGVLRLLDGAAAGVTYCTAAWRAFGNGCMQVASERLSAFRRAPRGAARGHSMSSSRADAHPVAHPLPHVTTQEDTPAGLEAAGGSCTQPHRHRHGICATLSPLLLAPGPASPPTSWLVACTSLRLRLLALLTHTSTRARGGSSGVAAAAAGSSSFVPVPPLLPPPPPQLVAPPSGAAGLQAAHAHGVGTVQAGLGETEEAAAATAAGGGSAGSGGDGDGAGDSCMNGPELERLAASIRTVTIAYGSLVASLFAVRQHAVATLQQYQAVGGAGAGAGVGLGGAQQPGAAVLREVGWRAGDGPGLYDTWLYDAATEASSSDANMCLATVEACLEVRALLSGQLAAPPHHVPGSSAVGARPGCILGDPGAVTFGASLSAYVHPESGVLAPVPHKQAAGGSGSGGGGGGSSIGGGAAHGSEGLDARLANPRAVGGSGQQLWGGHGGGVHGEGRELGGGLGRAEAASGMMARLGLQPTDGGTRSHAAGRAGDAQTRGAAGLCGRPVPTRDAVHRVYGLLSDTLAPAVVRLLASPQSHAGSRGVAPGVQRQQQQAGWEEQRMGAALGRALAAGGWEAGAGEQERQREVLRVLLMVYLLEWMTWALWVVGAI